MTLSRSKIRNFWQFVIIALLLFALLFLRSHHIVGPISVRNMTAVLILFIALASRQRRVGRQSVRLYYLWLAVYIVVNCFSLNIFDEHFYKNFVAYHLVSLILLYALPKIIYDRRRMSALVVLFTLFYIFNAIITVLQYTNNEIGWSIGNAIAPMNDFWQDRYELLSENENMLMNAICCGINGFVVTNGQFTACFLPLISFAVFSRKRMYRILSLLLIAAGFVTVICIQQRMGFVIIILYLIFMLWLKAKRMSLRALILVVGLLMIGVLSWDFDFDLEKLGRLSNFDDELRWSTFSVLSEFLEDPSKVLLGNCTIATDYDHNMLLTLGHNCFTDALRRAGIFGFLIFVCLFASILKSGLQSMRRGIECNDFLSVGLVLCLMFNLVYSLGHSDGIPSGSVFFWLSYALLICSEEIQKKEAEKNKEAPRPKIKIAVHSKMI